MKNDSTPDFHIRNEGSIILFTCCTPAARAWWDANVQCDQYFGSMGAVEYRYADNLISGMLAAGLTVSGG